jgi:hypothetical protein
MKHLLSRRTIAVRIRTRFFALPAACLSLAVFGTGCDNSSVNETTPAGTQASTAAPANNAPPPKSVKEYYERTQKATPPPKGVVAPKPKEEKKTEIEKEKN